MSRMQYRNHHLGLLDKNSTAAGIRESLKKECNKVKHQSEHTWLHTESRLLRRIGPVLDQTKDNSKSIEMK